MDGDAENRLYYGDNLEILKRYIKDETVDLVYLDPPFKSQQDYNVLFAERNGSGAAAQIKAFEDTWHWDKSAAQAYEDVVTSGGRIAEAMQAFRTFLGTSDMLAYLSMMAPRLNELRRVMRSTGSIYLHCDSTASHYLKMLMDAVFGPKNFRNEIIWKRKTGRGETNRKARRLGVSTDTLFFYSKTDDYYFNSQFTFDARGYREYVEKFYRFTDNHGRRYRIADLSSPSPRPNLIYDYKGYKPPKDGWAISKEKMEQWDREGRLEFPSSPAGRIQRRRYLDELKGKPVQNLWDDIEPLSSRAKERLDYPTQKPEALLERILETSSRKGDTVLDPFCGCGTTVSVAERLGRKWIGIDITHLAITLMRHRLLDAFGDTVRYTVIGEPVSLPDAEALAQQDPYQFQWWALGLVGARPVEQKKGADKGIDGRLYFFVEPGKAEQIIFSVKAGHVTASHVRDLHGVVDREKAAIGVLISLEEATQPMRSEAADGGFYTSKELGNPKYPRIQLLTIEDIFSGKKVECPHSVSSREVNPTFKQAPKSHRKAERRGKQSSLGEHEDEDSPADEGD